MATDPSIFDNGPFAPCPHDFNLARHTFAAGLGVPDKPALEVITAADAPAEIWTYAELTAAVQGTMTGLTRSGISPGDKVLLRIDHSIDFPILFFAAIGLGAVPIPTSPQLTTHEVTQIYKDLAPQLTIASPGLSAPEAAIPAADTVSWRTLPPTDFANTSANDPAYIIFTSGTGGTPKGVVHAHRAGWARRMMWDGWYGLSAEDRLLHAGAFNWTYTLGTGLTDPWAAGATALIYAGPPSRGVWAGICKSHSPTIFAASPGVYRQMLSTQPDPAAFASLRHGLTAGEAMPPALRSTWTDLTRKPLYGALGMSEVSTYVSQSPGQPKAVPQQGRRIAILDDTGTPVPRGTPGQLAVSASDPGLMLGYWDGTEPRLPLTGEWFLTGDRACLAADNSLTHLGRLDDILNAQGYRVSAREVEECLCLHPAISEAAVVSLPVRRDVNVLAAFVTTNADVTAEDLKSHCASRLATYKTPREIRILDALPRSATGKLVKRRLVADHGWKEQDQ